VADKVVGVVGLGRIGVLVAQRLSAFGVKLIAYDPYVQPARAAQLGVRMVSLDDLLAEADFITVHLPKTPETVGLIGDEALHKVKPTVHIINAARGGIVDEAALYQALVDGRVAGAGLDVFNKEPCTDSPLFTLEQVVATPHLGASTDEAQEKAGIAVARSVRLAFLTPSMFKADNSPRSSSRCCR
jgi:D-3-phosphoglycerate dehydrogenase